MNPVCTASVFFRSTILFVLALLIAPSVAVADAPLAPSVTRFVQTYCIECHGGTKPKGDFRVDALKIAKNAADAENWQLVLDNLQLGEMPPKDAKQPKPSEVEQVTSWIQTELSRAAAELKGTGGEVVLRRLNARNT